MFNSRSPLCAVAALAIGTICLQATAGDTVPLASLKTCAAIEASGERLACYDRLAKSVHDSDARQETPALTQEQMFGMRGELVRQDEPQKKATAPALSSITAHVKSLANAADGSVLVMLDNGQTWRQEDSVPLELEPGDEVTISRGAFSSFRMTSPGHRTGRVIRVR